MHEQRPWKNLLHVIAMQLLPPLAFAAMALFGKWLLGLWITDSLSYLGFLLGVIPFWYWLPRMQKKVRALNRERYALRQAQKDTALPAN